MEQTTVKLKEKLLMLDKAIDLGVSKGAYNKVEVVELVRALQDIYIFIDDKSIKPTEK